KFRGDASLLENGLDFVRQRTGRQVLGVLPFDREMQLDEEDSLGLPSDSAPLSLDGRGIGSEGGIDVAVIRLPGLSNFTDFAALTRAPGVAVRYVVGLDQLQRPDLVILPGTRTTLRSLNWLRATGLAAALASLVAQPDGPNILGLCGGYQILGHTIHDP